MAEPHPFEEILQQISEILEFTKKNQEKKLSDEKLDDALLEQVENLEKEIELFRKITEEAIQKSGLTEEQVNQMVQQPASTKMSAKEKKVLEKSKRMKEELQELQQEYAKKSRVVKLEKKKSKTAGKKRKKKFKRLGGQGWMPL